MKAAATVAETGLNTLAAEGLQLADAPEGSRTEVLRWVPVAEPVDADKPLLMWVRYGDGDEAWEAGYLDAEGWRFSYSGGLVADFDGGAQVLFHADPQGPRP